MIRFCTALLFSFFLFLNINYLRAQTFEGEIRIVRESNTDTTAYVYLIRNNLMRIEELGNDNQVSGIMIFDFNENTTIACLPSKKLYMDISLPPVQKASDKENYELISSGNSKMMHGFKCEQFRVRNKLQNTEVSFWLADIGFSYFPDFISASGRPEKTAQYSLFLPDRQGWFPFLSEVRTLIRELKLKVYVTVIKKMAIPADLFNVPSGYTKFEK